MYSGSSVFGCAKHLNAQTGGWMTEGPRVDQAVSDLVGYQLWAIEFDTKPRYYLAMMIWVFARKLGLNPKIVLVEQLYPHSNSHVKPVGTISRLSMKSNSDREKRCRVPPVRVLRCSALQAEIHMPQPIEKGHSTQFSNAECGMHVETYGPHVIGCVNDE